MRKYKRETQKGRILERMGDGCYYSVYDFPPELSYTLRNRISEMKADGVVFTDRPLKVGRTTVKQWRLATYPVPLEG